MDTAVVSQVGGGDYSWSKKGQVPTAGGKDSLVIYSYGDGNTYYHPTMDGHYTSHGWLKKHHTAISGDYEETIQLDL